MKKKLFPVCFFLITVASYGQIQWQLLFDDTTHLNRIFIDRNSNPDNCWQIGRPDKNTLDFPYSAPNVIVTDTANPYPPGSVSSFIIAHIADWGWFTAYPGIYIDGWYWVDSDSLTDYGMIEFSADMGKTWFNVDSIENNGCCFAGQQYLPVFTGKSNGWQFFHYCLCVHNTVQLNDTILYRFSFISDNVQTNKDGLMFDNLEFTDFSEGTNENYIKDPVSVYPVPADDVLRISCPVNISSVEIYDHLGRLVYFNPVFRNDFLDVSSFTNGIYFLKFTDSKSITPRKFLIKH